MGGDRLSPWKPLQKKKSFFEKKWLVVVSVGWRVTPGGQRAALQAVTDGEFSRKD